MLVPARSCTRILERYVPGAIANTGMNSDYICMRPSNILCIIMYFLSSLIAGLLSR
jgi:hypothetical protein